MTDPAQGFPHRSECSYPGDEIAHHKYTFCCAPVVPGKPYCAPHMQMTRTTRKYAAVPAPAFPD